MECTTKTPAELYDEAIPQVLKNASRKLCGKLIKHAVLNPEDKRAAIYNAFDRNPEDKKMPYDDFLKAYGLHSGHLTCNAFEEHRRVHSFAEGIYSQKISPMNTKNAQKFSKNMFNKYHLPPHFFSATPQPA